MTPDKATSKEENFNPLDIDRLVHEPARYAIMAHLYVLESADFIFLTQQIGLTPGNLSVHMSRLESAGYIEVKKEFLRRKPHTMVSLTLEGRHAFETYRKYMKQVVEELPKKVVDKVSDQLAQLGQYENVS